MDDIDVAIVGLGLAGSAAARAVSRRGRSVAAFEAYGPGHRRGSSHGRARIFRRAYLDPLYVELTGRAGRLWEELGEQAGERLLTRTGGVDHGRGREPERMARLLRDHGVAAELLDPAEAARRWPGIRFTGPVVLDPEGGVVDPEAAIAALVRLAAEDGAHIAYDTPVRTMEPDSTGVRLRTDEGTWHARTVVVAAGGWTGPLLDGLVPLPPLTVTRQQVFFFAPEDAGPWPTVVHGETSLDLYALPEGPYVKLGEHAPGPVTTAADRDFTVDPAARERAMAYARTWLPGLDPVPRSELTCLYTWTPDEDFVIDRRGPFVVCSPCSGHGAKFTPLLGELAADLVDGRPPIDRFALR
ncbi:N-methyl-L-tryptophan oxidase [Actinoallomurus purpureus]|uniref:N-methyl-L-tryptophan oxidase n=1 Tax=Actinoallomurus purpureus TaxID=478114 RepID=UPI0020929CBF|nr:N-methyl-L-tryptophan oxidase [Actinoallomurus purpureus]MCO6010324.1 N-methyl-L-tryptophan oxidase [Actinoallomurus purpureus]